MGEAQSAAHDHWAKIQAKRINEHNRGLRQQSRR
jgi:hypothetical protein